ncbi:MAG: TlpA family protein disulfide reductase [Pyrinomonadaceae bacterium]|jgi:thiol-disulfide isomerase/thioredoxin|nr:TlpA family protein disulfide reductase [Pyrinomonadaceae bacterium]
MKRLIFYFCLFTFAFLLLTACRPPAKPLVVSNEPNSGKIIPPTKNIEEMSWMSLDGDSKKLKDFQGSVVVLDFWATYCPPCLEGIPHFIELQKKYKDDIKVVGLNVGGPEDKPKIPAFINKFDINYTIATPENELINIITQGDTTIPQTAVFDRQGKMVKKFVGFNNEIRKQIDVTVEETIKK